MPSIRIGFSTDFNLTSEQVGIGTTLPTARLDVRGQIRSDNAAGGGGISTFTEYQGFLHSKQGIGNTVSIAQTTKGNLNSLSGEIVISGEVTVSEGTPIGGGRLDSLTVTSSFDLPRGGSTNREVAPEKGSTRFNQDLGQLEFYTGYEWRTVGSIDGTGRGRGVFSGGASPSISSIIDYINIASTGNALNFGSLSSVNSRQSGCSSEIRGLFGGGGPSPAVLATIEYITIASQGNPINFGSLSQARETTGSCSSSTRGIWMGGRNPLSTNVIDYVQIGTLGNALDFGDLTTAKQWMACCSSPIRGIAAGGETSTRVTTIESVTISSTGNSIYFGDLTQQRGIISNGITSGVRGVFGGGEVSPFNTNRIDYITIATFGNAIFFGDLTVTRFIGAGASSKIRGIFAGGNNANDFNTIDFVTIASTGNAQDFGDLTLARWAIGAVSDSHGGLGGF
jgi:hypothetical protein